MLHSLFPQCGFAFFAPPTNSSGVSACFSKFFCCSLPPVVLVIPGGVVGIVAGTVGARAGAVGAPVLNAVDVPGFDPLLL